MRTFEISISTADVQLACSATVQAPNRDRDSAVALTKALAQACSVLWGTEVFASLTIVEETRSVLSHEDVRMDDRRKGFQA